MGTFITGPPLGAPASSESQMAWHLAALLLSLGHPARPASLASRCTLFSVSPELVEFLCSIPKSPIFLTTDLYVTLSAVAVVAVGRFISVNDFTASSVLPRVEIGASSTANWWNDFSTSRMCFRKRNRVFLDCDFLPVAKRAANIYSVNVGELDQTTLLSPKRICNGYLGSSSPLDNIIRSVSTWPINRSLLSSSIFDKSYGTHLTVEVEKVYNLDAEIDTKELVPPGEVKEKIVEPESDVGLVSPSSILENPAQCKETKLKKTFRRRKNVNDTCKDFKPSNVSLLVGDQVNGSSGVANIRISESKRILESNKTSRLMSSDSMKPVQNIVQPSNNAILKMPPKGDTGRIHKENCNQVKHFNGKQSVVDVKNINIATDPSSVQKFSQSPSKLNAMHSDASAPTLQDLSKTLHNYRDIDSHEEKQHCNRDMASLGKGQKKNCTGMHIKERRGTSLSTCPEDEKKLKGLPTFESYIVEEEEGSGGYGIVYKARRKNDGATVAIKCPHAKAHGQHVTNELKMLERFGGKNFIIKYEGSFKNGNTDCFVLEHIEHDRPEVLKKEIDIVQIRWYGYCMFRALASLHKRGVIHRDVKPGNFLFSRNLNKGYLIDFNLAKDLHQKHGNISSTKCRKSPNVNFVEAADQRTTKGSKSIIDPKDNRRKIMGQSKTKNDSSGRVMKSQGADGSGVTSAKDVTSTRTSFAEKLRKTLPSQGRKELINYLQEALLGTNQQPSSIPAPMRKRIPAPRGKVDSELVYITPMPLHSTGIDVTDAGFLKNKGTGKQTREGSCVGTKGFRAPEVLFKSPHQGPKLDIWSVGVSLLYLIIGKTPFTGDPEQNIKDIAKLRGSEDLWEVAKLHNRESSFPVDLYGKQSLPSIGLRDWCLLNTKRPEFIEVIPATLFDLLERCLKVNPRVRISAEEALRHEFFAPCYESLRKQKICKQEFLT